MGSGQSRASSGKLEQNQVYSRLSSSKACSSVEKIESFESAPRDCTLILRLRLVVKQTGLPSDLSNKA